MRISKQLNLVVPLNRGDEPKVYVHATPISVETFETFYSVIAKTFTQIYSGGYGTIGGPRVADKVMRDVAIRDGVWETKDAIPGVKDGLIGEIRRRANVLAMTPKGEWEQVPYDSARSNGLLDQDEVLFLEGTLCFFTVLWWMHTPDQRLLMLQSATSLLDARIESSTCTDYRNYLSTSTTVGNSGAKVAASSVPS
jgi:hypothetical protein